MKQLFFLFTITLIVQSCGTNCDCENLPSDEPSPFRVSFNGNLGVGQHNTYVNVIGENFFDDTNANFQYGCDTLTLDVINDYGGGWFLLRETITEGACHTSNSPAVLTYQIKIANDTLRFRNFTSSHLFPISQAGSLALPLAKFTGNSMSWAGWKPKPANLITQTQPYIENIRMHTIFHKYLNLFYDAGDSPVDGPALLVLYSEYNGLVGTIAFGGNALGGTAWANINKD